MIHSKLNNYWNKLYSQHDVLLWNEIKRFYLGKDENGKERYAIDEIRPEDKGKIDYLLNKYYTTEKGNSIEIDRFNIYTKLPMLKRVMEQLLEYHDENEQKENEEQRLKDTSPEDIRIMEDELKRDSSLKISSRIDYPHEDLPEEFWDKDDEKYTLKKEIKDELHNIVFNVLEENFDNPEEWVNALVLGSSLNSQFWKTESDIDIKVAIELDEFIKNNTEFEGLHEDDIKEIILAVFDEYKDDEEFKYETHPIDLYPIFSHQLEDKEFTKKYDSIYDIENNIWLKPVKKVDIESYDRDEAVAEGEAMAMSWAQKWDLEIGEIRRKSKEFKLVEEYVNSLDGESANKFKIKIEAISSIIKKDIETIHLEKEVVKKLYYDAYDNYNEDLEKFYGSVNAQPEVIRIKLLNLWGYLKMIRSLNKIIKNKEDINSKDVKKINDIVASIRISSRDVMKKPEKNPEEYDQKQLKDGTKVEMEHTTDKDIAADICMNHLDENPHYYSYLIPAEKEWEKEEEK